MSNESLKMGESFTAEKIPAGGSRPTKPRHAVIGWSVLVAIALAVAYWLDGGGKAPAFLERPGLHESLGQKIGGVLNLAVLRATGTVERFGPFHNTIVNAGETALRDCFGGTGTPTCTPVQNFKFHGMGTSSAAIAETDTGCTTELTTQYTSDNTRPTGTQANNGANVYETVATVGVDASVTVREFCLMSQAAVGGGTMWTRILTGDVALVSGDSIQFTYRLTIE